MGNSMGGKRRRAMVMKIDGSTTKVKPPATAGDVLRDHPSYALLESEQVRRLGVRAKPLDHGLPLKPGKLYFLVDLPKLPADGGPRPGPGPARRVRSGIDVSAKDRLETLMLSRRAASDVSFARVVPGGDGGGPVRVRLRLPRAEVARLVAESGDPAEAAERILEFCADADADGAGGGGREGPGAAVCPTPAPGKAVSGTVPEKKEKRTRFFLAEDQIIN